MGRMDSPRAYVATAHPETTAAAGKALEVGGNAVDGLIAAGWTACVAEPVFASLGGGGYALVRMHGRAPAIADFFTQTPRRRRAGDADFFPIHGNFGTDVQEFHIGLGAAATPGLVAGLYALHERHARLPMDELIQPALALARNGLELNPVQREAMQILEPIVRASDGAARIFGLEHARDAYPAVGDRVCSPLLADCLEWIARHGPEAFYRGEIAAAVARQSTEHGGHLGLRDLHAYRVHWRRPVGWDLDGRTRVWSNPPPAFGGIMVALMTRALEDRMPSNVRFGSDAHLDALVAAMRSSEDRRRQLERPECLASGTALMRAWRTLSPDAPRATRGTTHISVRDSNGNIAGMTLSNGEGCGRAVPGCGFMLNNMLGEQDLNPLGFHQWPTNRRLSSMMAPTLVRRGAEELVLGSGGSNRIRTAIAQVLVNLMHFDMTPEQAVAAPRMHLEGAALALERGAPGWPDSIDAWLESRFPDARRWPDRSLYFGGVQIAAADDAVADPRRMGHACSIRSREGT